MNNLLIVQIKRRFWNDTVVDSRLRCGCTSSNTVHWPISAASYTGLRGKDTTARHSYTSIRKVGNQWPVTNVPSLEDTNRGD